jgi:GT2 family glycosyltransferase
MQVHILKPFRVDKNLGKAYNEAMQLIPENDWACLCDLDTCFLTPDAGNILHEYAFRFPDTGIFTCFTNRVSTLSVKQLLNGQVSDEENMTQHIAIAEDRKKFLYTVSTINRDISGMLMMVSKKVWNSYQFPEDKKCLGVDTYYNRIIRGAGLQILRMNGLYIWHTYRLKNGIKDKTHLL